MTQQLARTLGMVLVLVVTTVRAPGQAARATATIKDVAWLEGTWVSTSSQRTVEERWTPPAGGAMLAVSRTLAGDRLAEFEFLRIVERDGGLVYVAQPNGRPPTDFFATEVGSTSVRFENPQHDFPKMIRYEKRPDGTLQAAISGSAGQRELSWIFSRR
jgi:uncharacterized protein DUF6265